MRIQPPHKQSKNVLAPVLLALLSVCVIGGGILLAVLYSQNTPVNVPPFEIQSFAGKAELSLDGQSWLSPNPGESLALYQWVRTGPEGEMDLSFGKSTFVRLKENTAVQVQAPQVFSKAAVRLHLEKGTLLIASPEDGIQVSVPGRKKTRTNEGFLYDLFAKFVASTDGATFLISASPEKSSYQVSVLKGELKVHPGIPFASVSVKGLEMVQGGGLNKTPISEKEWTQVREAYEITPRSAASEAKQIDLSKKAGNFFGFVFDHGTFYQEKWGWCQREFVQPESVNDPIYMQADYDVFPKGSWVGIYFKTRNLDASKFKGFQLNVRRAPGKSFPEFIRIEMKNKFNILRAFAIKAVPAEWQEVKFPFSFSKETPITEFTVMFSNDKVGTDKAGAVQFKNFTLVPADLPAPKPVALIPAEKTPAAAAPQSPAPAAPKL